MEMYLQECLESITNQTLRDIEIICVDDGSTDKSVEILESFSEIDERIIIVKQKNKGAGAARNKGLEIAKGEYLSFLDADDFFELTMLEKSFEQAKALNSDIVIYRSDHYFDEEQKFVEVPWTISATKIPRHMPFSPSEVDTNIFRSIVGWAWDKLFRKSFIDEFNLKFQEIRIYNDLYFVFSAFILSRRISIIEEVFAHQRKRAGSLSGSKESAWKCVYDGLKGLEKTLIEHNLYNKYKRDFINYALYLNLYTLNSIHDMAYLEMYALLRDKWFDEFAISGYEKRYYFSPQDYKQLLYMQETEAMDDFMSKFKSLHEKVVKLEGAQDENSDNLSQKILLCESELNEIKDSISFRIGRLITCIPRKIRSGIRCYKEHGMDYTLGRFKCKVKNTIGG